MTDENYNDGIPRFEGEPVVDTKATVTSMAGLDVGGRVFKLDETTKLLVEVRCMGINHKPNNDGHLERFHSFKALDCVVVDWAMDMDALREALT